MFDTIFKMAFYTSHKSKCKYLRKHKAKIGNHVWMFIPVNNFGSEPWLVEIGNDVLISFGVYFVTHDGGISVINNMHPERKRVDRLGKIIVGNKVFIGCNSTTCSMQSFLIMLSLERVLLLHQNLCNQILCMLVFPQKEFVVSKNIMKNI